MNDTTEFSIDVLKNGEWVEYLALVEYEYEPRIKSRDWYEPDEPARATIHSYKVFDDDGKQIEYTLTKQTLTDWETWLEENAHDFEV